MGFIRCQKGIGIVEVLIAAIILSISALLAAQYFTNKNASSLKLRGYSSRDKVVSTVRTAALMASAVRNSFVFASNPNLEACVTQNPSFMVANKNLEDCVSSAVYQLSLYGPMVATNAGKTTATGAVSGTKVKPLYYDLTGTACPTVTSSSGAISSHTCMIQAWSEFRPQCPPAIPLGPPAPKCDVAETIDIVYHVEPVPNSVADNRLAFEPVVGSVAMSVRQISGEPPSIDTVLPMPSPVPFPSPTPPPIPGSSPQPPPQATIVHCPGDTIQYENSCACPPGYLLFNYFRPHCRLVGI